MRKLMYRVVFPFELKLRNTTEECPDADELYSLFAVVVHVGSGPNHGAHHFPLAFHACRQRHDTAVNGENVCYAGHYVSFVKSHSRWLFFDDECVEPISEAMVQTAFGSPQEYNSSSMDHGYILMFSRQSLEPPSPQSDHTSQHSNQSAA